MCDFGSDDGNDPESLSNITMKIITVIITIVVIMIDEGNYKSNHNVINIYKNNFDNMIMTIIQDSNSNFISKVAVIDVVIAVQKAVEKAVENAKIREGNNTSEE